MHTGEVFIPIVLFLVLFGAFYLYMTARHKERMALIDKGADPSFFYSGRKMNIRQILSWWTLKIGLFLIGVSIGILIGNILAETTRLDEGVCYASSILMFGGLGLVAYYFYEKRQFQDMELEP